MFPVDGVYGVMKAMRRSKSVVRENCHHVIGAIGTDTLVVWSRLDSIVVHYILIFINTTYVNSCNRTRH